MPLSESPPAILLTDALAMPSTPKDKLMELPTLRIPERKSSRNLRQLSLEQQQQHHRQSTSATSHLRAPSEITVRGNAVSPLKKQSSRPMLLRTFVPRIFPYEILDAPRLSHPRVQVGIVVESPVFIGGATVEGTAQIQVDANRPDARRLTMPTVSIQQVSVSIIGIEHCRRRHDIFRALTTHLMQAGDTPVADTIEMPFCLDLPVNMGPPPYRTKKAGIRYLLSALVVFEIEGKTVFVRQSREVCILTICDPEKTLANLSEPIVARDELKLGRQSVFVKTGIHRQTWISGYPLFVDVHFDNVSSKTIRKVELQLERATIFFIHSTPAIHHHSSHAVRVPERVSKEVIARTVIEASLDPILPMTDAFRTVQMNVPCGLASVETGRFFCVRYAVNVKISAGLGKNLTLQLPISIIHPNTVDIPPNSIAQVAESLEQKQSTRASSGTSASSFHYQPGHAFHAARRQSRLELRQDAFGSSDMESLARAIEASPRRFQSSPPRLVKYSSMSTLRPRNSQARMKPTRRPSLAALDGRRHSRFSSASQTMKQLRQPQNTSDTSGRQSFAARRAGLRSDVSQPQASDDMGISASAALPLQSQTRPTSTNDEHTSGLERDVKRHLRMVSDSTTGTRSLYTYGSDGIVIGLESSRNFDADSGPSKKDSAVQSKRESAVQSQRESTAKTTPLQKETVSGRSPGRVYRLTPRSTRRKSIILSREKKGRGGSPSTAAADGVDADEEDETEGGSDKENAIPV